MTTSSAMARELSVLLGARIGSAEVPHVSVEMRALSTGWLIYARHRGDEVEAQCSTSDLNYPPEVFQGRVLGPIARELARLYGRRVTAHIRAGLNPYRPGKMAEVRKPRRVKNARTNPGPWSEPRKLKPAEIYLQGRELRVAPEEMPLPPGAKFLPPADDPICRIDVAFSPEEAARHHFRLYGHVDGPEEAAEVLKLAQREHMQREGAAFGRDMDQRIMDNIYAMSYGPDWAADMERTKQATGIYLAGRAPSYASQQAAPVDYSGHRLDPEAISRAAGAGMQAAQPGRPHLPPEYAWMADQPKRWAWAFPALMALLVGVAAGLIALHFLQHWNL